MKSLFSDIKVKMVVKSLMANGVCKNLKLKVKGNRIHIGEISFSEVNGGNKLNINLDKKADGSLEVSGDSEHKIIIKNLFITKFKTEEFSVETLELNSIAEGLELFASLVK